ncbi:39S ribosomal protein L21, mitochondrial [Aphelenchoides fujianensis]|nr:39S ribosomal protein L21, mitochondrial [Aphelenchoides fujianensis]
MSASVAARIAEQVVDKSRRLFAVIAFNGRQFKVNEGDIIHIEHNVPLQVSDRIKLEKVLAVGGADFTLLGRPLLNPEMVSVKATVIEKTTTSPEPAYTKVAGKKIEKLDWLSRELTVLRINQIHVDESQVKSG